MGENDEDKRKGLKAIAPSKGQPRTKKGKLEDLPKQPIPKNLAKLVDKKEP